MKCIIWMWHLRCNLLDTNMDCSTASHLYIYSIQHRYQPRMIRIMLKLGVLSTSNFYLGRFGVMDRDIWTCTQQINFRDLPENCYGHSAMKWLVKNSQSHYEVRWICTICCIFFRRKICWMILDENISKNFQKVRIINRQH